MKYIGLDARQLAKLLRGNFLQGVYHDDSDREHFRDLMSAYEDVIKLIVRLKNQHKSIYRKEGCRERGDRIYGADIHAAKIVAQVINPRRFRNKYKYWSYCGLVSHVKESGGQSYGREKSRGNLTLKCVYKMAGFRAV